MFNRLFRYFAWHPMVHSPMGYSFEKSLRRWYLVRMLEQSNYYYPQCYDTASDA